MSYNQSPSSKEAAHSGARRIDAGLQAYMQSVYHTMGLGLIITGLTAYAVAATPVIFNAIFGTPLAWVVMLAPLAFIWFGFTPARVAKMPVAKLRFIFLLFSAVMGLSMAVIFQAFTGASIARVFFITSGTFAATSLYGYTTKRDLTGVGSFMFMGLIGIVIASVVNMFLQSSMVQFVVSVIGVIVFTGLTAWDTQNLKRSYRTGAHTENSKTAIVGALSLYLNFINLFQMMLHLMGDRR